MLLTISVSSIVQVTLYTALVVVARSAPDTSAFVTSKSLQRPSRHLLERQSLNFGGTIINSKTVLYNSYQPMFSKMTEMASSVFKRGLMVSASSTQVDQALANLNIASWDDIRSSLELMMKTDEERSFRKNIERGYGIIGSPLNKIRLYDSTNNEQDIRVIFYRDSASWCPYCQKVWMALEEKRIPYRVEKINMSCYGTKPVDFMRMQPSGQIPVAMIDGVVYRQSNDILQALEASFPNHKSLQPQTGQEQVAQELLRLERQLFSAWMSWLTTSGSSEAYRSQFIGVLSRVESALGARVGPFFMGNQVSMVDFMFAPFLERMCASLVYFKGYVIRVPPGTETKWPAINQWFDGMEKLPSYQLTKSDYYTHCHDLPPQLGGCTYELAGEIYRQAIDGKDRIISAQGTEPKGSWELPLQKHNDGIEPDWGPWAGIDEEHQRREAVERITANYKNIIRFASRGAGQPGFPPVSAPLADPNALPNEAVQESVNTVLRIVCLAMLDGADTQYSTMNRAADAMVREANGFTFAQDVADSLAYMRDRVGVPRDMKLPAARLLRAHLNWAIEIIETRQQNARINPEILATK